jgi:hypothetical protein
VVRFRALACAAIACAGLLAASCSLTRLVYDNAALAYSNATPVLTWLVADYVDLTDAQREFVRKRLKTAFAWHRADELPGYRRFLETVLRQADDHITVDEARADYRDLRERYARLLERVLPDIADFLAQLDSEQALYMERRFAEDNRKILDESTRGTEAERMARRVKRFLEHISEFTGPLDAAQREIVARQVTTVADPVEERLADRRYRQAAVLALVRGKPSREEAVAVLRRLLVHPESWRSAEYVAKLHAREEKLFVMVSELSATLSAGQRAFFQKRVRGFMSDIAELTAAS